MKEEQDRAIREILSQLRGLWDELAKVTDWTWRNEQRIDELEKRIIFNEKHYLNLTERQRDSS